jgi:hypothetical protein
VAAGPVPLKAVDMVIKTGTEETGVIVSMRGTRAVALVVAGAEGSRTGEEIAADDGDAGEAAGEDARIEDGIIGYAGWLRVAVAVAAYGHQVVYRMMVSVVTWPLRAGQSVTVAAQLVIVYTVVVYTVEMVPDGAEGAADGGTEQLLERGAEDCVEEDDGVVEYEPATDEDAATNEDVIDEDAATDEDVVDEDAATDEDVIGEEEEDVEVEEEELLDEELITTGVA